MDFEKEADFIGNVSVKDMRCSMEVLFAEVRKLRVRLGEQAEDFIGTNPLGCQEVQTKISLYTVMLSGSYLEMMAERFRGGLKSELLEELDPVGLQKLRGQLCEKLSGAEEIDRIDQLFRQSLMMVSPLACCLQGAADALLGDLISQDKGSDKLNFQLLVEGKA